MTKQAVAQEPVAGPLVPVRSSALSMAGRDLHVVADSDSRSLVIVPLEFSHCLTLHGAQPEVGERPALSRIDGPLTGIVFEHHLDAVLSFRVGPLSNPSCRWRDYQDVKAMLP